MDTPEAKPAAPFQFGVRALLLLTAAVAVVCSIGAWIGWLELFGVVMVLTPYLAYLLFFLFVRWYLAWDSAMGAVPLVILSILLTVALVALFIGSILFLLNLVF